jgi:hypothetical protein
MVDFEKERQQLEEVIKMAPSMKMALMEIDGFESWTEDEVLYWMDTLELKDIQKAKKFIKNMKADGAQLLILNSFDFVDSGVDQEDRRAIMNGIAQLKKKELIELHQENQMLKRKLALISPEQF